MPEKIAISLKLDADVLDALDDMCQRTRRSRPKMIEALVLGLDNAAGSAPNRGKHDVGASDLMTMVERL